MKKIAELKRPAPIDERLNEKKADIIGTYSHAPFKLTQNDWAHCG
jgi:hypothetical protein